MFTDPAAARLDGYLGRIAEGDQQALRALYSATSPALFALSLRITGRQDTAEDVLQEMYLAVWRKAGQYDPGKGESMAWLKAVLRNKALDALRKRATDRSFVPPSLEAFVDPSPSPHAIVEHSDLGEQIHRHLGALRPRDARALRSIYFDGMSYIELAAREHVPVATAKSWVRRALLKIRRLYPSSYLEGWRESGDCAPASSPTH